MTNEDPLLARLDGVQASIDGVREDLKHRIRTTRRAVVAALVVAVVGLAVGALGVRAQINATNNTRRARVASCQQYNRQQKAQADAEVKQSEDFVTQLTKGSTDPRVADRVKSYNREHDRLIRRSHSSRDCTPAGIRAYLQSPATTKESA